MNFTIFAKKAQNADGKPFTRYITKLQKKDGKTITATVKFRGDCGTPMAIDCPMNLVVDKANANMAIREVTNEDTGEVRTYYTLWVTDWAEGTPYIDHSLDDFDD